MVSSIRAWRPLSRANSVRVLATTGILVGGYPRLGATASPPRAADDPDLRDLLRVGLRRLRAARRAPAWRARASAGLGLRDDFRRARRGPGRGPARLRGRELEHRAPGSARQPVLGVGARLVRGDDRWGAGRGPVGLAPELPGSTAARLRGAAAGARIRDRADRVPGLRRRRLRDRFAPSLGDVLPARNQADRHPGAAHADLRDAGDGAHRPRALAAARPGAPGHPVRPLAAALWPWAGTGGGPRPQRRGRRT